MKFKFGSTIVKMNGTRLIIEITTKEALIAFTRDNLRKLINKYPTYTIEVNGPKDVIATNKGDYIIINNKKENLGKKISTIATLFSVTEKRVNEGYVYDMFFKNFHNTTGFYASCISEKRMEFEPFEKYFLNGFFINKKRDLKDYEEKMKYIPTFFKINSIKKINENIEIFNYFEIFNDSRTPATGFSSYSSGYMGKTRINLIKKTNKIKDICLTDDNTLSWVEKDFLMDSPLGLHFYFYDDIEGTLDSKKYSATLYINSKNQIIPYFEETIEVNEGIRSINELISNSLSYKNKYLFPLSKLMEIKEKGLIKLGSMDKGGVIFDSLLENDYKTLEKYINLFDYIGIEPLSNLMKLVFSKENVTLGSLKRINQKIKAIGDLKNKKVIFADNAVVATEEEREIAKCYTIAEYIKEKCIKDSATMKKIYKAFPVVRIPHLHSTMEMWKELAEQGFTAQELLDILKNEKKLFDELPKKRNIVVIPNKLIIPTNRKLKDNIKNIVIKKVIEIYGDKPPAFVMNRLKKELGIILKNNYEILFILAKTVSKRAQDMGYFVGDRGTAGSLFISYLLELTDTNPLPRHNYCPNCKSIEENEICSKCGEITKEDGANLDYRMFFGPNCEKVPDLDMNVPREIIKQIVTELKESFSDLLMSASTNTYLKSDGMKSHVYSKLNGSNEIVDVDYAVNVIESKYSRTQPHNSGILICSPAFDLNYVFPTVEYNGEKIPLYDYHKLDRVFIKLDVLSKNGMKEISEVKKNISLEDKEIYEKINRLETDNIQEMNTNYFKKIISIVKPTKFEDLVKMQGLAHGEGVFMGNADELIKNNKRYISSREDLLDILDEYKVEGSFAIMETIRKGRYTFLTETELKELEKLPEYLKKSIEKIRYLFPKAHAIAYAKACYYTMYYYQNLKNINSKKVADIDESLFEEFL